MATLIILDTDVLIDYFRGIEGARHYLEALPVTHRKITEITVMELFKGARNKKELQQIEQFLLANEFRSGSNRCTGKYTLTVRRRQQLNQADIAFTLAFNIAEAISRLCVRE